MPSPLVLARHASLWRSYWPPALCTDRELHQWVIELGTWFCEPCGAELSYEDKPVREQALRWLGTRMFEQRLDSRASPTTQLEC